MYYILVCIICAIMIMAALFWKNYWEKIASTKPLSEEFIEKHADELNWNHISQYQKLSEKFIEKYSDKVCWFFIFTAQKLSEEFIEKHSNKIRWEFVSSHQHLSESFIRRCSFNPYKISLYQKVSDEFIKEHNLTIPDTCWLYKDKEYKRKYIQENTNYQIIGDKVIAYKSCRSNGYSIYNFQYKYEEGQEYEAHADHNINEEQSFGLSAWDIKNAIYFYPYGKLFMVEIDLDNIAAITNSKKIRAKKIKIIDTILK